jgi:hypothetical protein
MINIRVSGDHVGMQVDQWCEVIEYCNVGLLVRSLDDPRLTWHINPMMITGVKLAEKLRVTVEVTQLAQES